MLRASVAIATWNRHTLLEMVLKSLVSQTIPSSEYEVIVCDSDSTDSTKDLVLTLVRRYPNIRYINVPENNPAAKRNAAIRAAVASIVILLDDDAVPEANFVEAHIRAHVGRELVLYCGQIRYPSEWIQTSNYFRYRDSRHLGPKRPEIDCDNLPPWMITTMNMSFKRDEIVSRAGYLSEEFSRYGGEDVEFGLRIASGGIRMVYLPQALIRHYEYEGSIRKYFRKLYISSCDSAPILFKLAPEFRNATKVRYLEHIYANHTFTTCLLRMGADICISRRSVQLLIGFLEATDRYSWLYSKFAYFYLTSIATTAGIRDRSQQWKKSMWFD